MSIIIKHSTLGLGITQETLYAWNQHAERMSWKHEKYGEQFTISADIRVDGKSLCGEKFDYLEVLNDGTFILERDETKSEAARKVTLYLHSYLLGDKPLETSIVPQENSSLHQIFDRIVDKKEKEHVNDQEFISNREETHGLKRTRQVMDKNYTETDQEVCKRSKMGESIN